MEQLNNREIATLLWGVITFISIFIFSLTKNELYLSLKQIFKSFFNIKIITPIILIMLYTIFLVYILKNFHIWDYSQLKNTFFWFITFAIGSLFQLNSIRENSNSFFKKTLKSSLNLTAILQFIINFKSFSLLIEFVLIIPIITLLSIFSTIASENINHRKVKELLDWLLSIIFISFFINFLINTIQDYKFFLNTQSLKDFFIPILLTTLYIPFLWTFILYIEYEETFIRLHFFIKNKKIINLAKLLIIINFRSKKDYLESWFDYIKIHPISNQQDLYKSIEIIKIRKAKEKYPSVISPQVGWSPHEAKCYLQGLNLTVKYKDIGDEIWFGSKSIELGAVVDKPKYLSK